MSHHGSEIPANWDKQHTETVLGATGEYPDGKINQQDKGEIAVGIAVHEGKLIMDFGAEPVHWGGLTKKEAIELVKHLNNKIHLMS